MRILYLITRAEPGGAQVHVLELLKGFRGRAELHLAVGEDKDAFLVEAARGLGIEVHRIRHLVHPIDPRRDSLAFWEIVALLRRLRPTLLHAHSSKAGFLGRVAARALGIRSLFTAHGWAFTEGVSVGRKALAVTLEALAGRLGDGIIAVSEWDRNLALRYRVAAPNRIFTVWNGVPDTSHRADPAREPPRIAMVARFAPPKDHALLLTALASLRELPWTLDLVGDGPLLPEVQALAKRLGLAERVRFWGRRLDVDRLLAEVQVFVLTSNWEGLPLVVLEAMRAGLPVVASDVGGLREAVRDGETGFLVARGNALQLQDRLRELLVHPSLRVQMGLRGRLRYEEHFRLERMLERTWAVYGYLWGWNSSP